MTDSYTLLLEHFRKIAALGEVSSLLHWDQETMMPSRGADVRAEMLAAVEAAQHQARTDPRVDDWLQTASDNGDALRAANLREIRREVERARRLPATLVAELARCTSLAHGQWVQARKAERLAGSTFADTLAHIVALKREEAACLTEPSSGAHPYDALLDTFEPGAKTQDVQKLFADLQPGLTSLLSRITDSGVRPQRIGGTFAADTQLALAREVATRLGYDFSAGRLDLTAHPFTTGSVPTDVRITTRIDPASFEDCLYSTIHEVGHALYEQGIDEALALSPAGRAASMGIHESQSRLFENQIGKSRSFVGFLYRKLTAAFADLSPHDPDALWASLCRVGASFIRTDADEVTYNLHIILRFELELALLEGTIEIGDVETAWNERMQAYLGITPERPSQGVLQDIHWAAGYFGYFPTYTLGNVFAAELWRAIEKDLGPQDKALAEGDVSAVRAWLRDKVHKPGRMRPAPKLIEEVLGHPPHARALLDYLGTKYAALYEL